MVLFSQVVFLSVENSFNFLLNCFISVCVEKFADPGHHQFLNKGVFSFLPLSDLS